MAPLNFVHVFKDERDGLFNPLPLIANDGDKDDAEEYPRKVTQMRERPCFDPAPHVLVVGHGFQCVRDHDHKAEYEVDDFDQTIVEEDPTSGWNEEDIDEHEFCHVS